MTGSGEANGDGRPAGAQRRPDSAIDLNVARRLEAIRQRYTRGRRLLVDSLLRARRPLTVTEIVSGGSELPASSAYRNLAILEQAAVVRRVQLSGEFARYELSEELTSHHHHLVCVDCGSVVDVNPPPLLEANVSATAKEVAAATGFRLESHRLDLIGHCQACS
ncbi:MAG TPA: transcriptional repressor [Candidatus Dormibacteraeota bacterium]